MALSKIDVANMLTGLVPNDNTIRRPDSKPLVVNGDLMVAQRGTSFTANGYNLDRFVFDNSNDGAVTVTQDSTVPSGQGFSKSVKFDVTTADGTLAANQYCQWTQKFEGQNLQLLKYGTSSAENLTLAFWVRSNKTGTYSVRFVKEAGGQTRYECPIIYTIDSADTWEKKVINLSPTAGSTSLITGTAGAIINTNAAGYRIAWIFAAGSNFHATNNTWVGASDKFTTDAQANLLDNTNNELYITGVQLEVGEFSSTTIPPFQHESFGDNLARCQRYFQNLGEGTEKPLANGFFWEAQEFMAHAGLNAIMRAEPTLEYVTASNYYSILRNGGTDQLDALVISGSSSRSYIRYHLASGQGVASDTKNRPGQLMTANSSSRVGVTAEL